MDSTVPIYSRDGRAAYQQNAVSVPPCLCGLQLQLQLQLQTSGLELFLLRRREQHVVQDQPVARRVRVERQVGRRVADLVLRVLRIVPPEEGPGALPPL